MSIDTANSHQPSTTFACPHCGKTIHNAPLSAYQVREAMVANWLQGQLAPIAQQDFDVWQCDPFPSLTFQVKHSTVGSPQKRGSNLSKTSVWTFNHRVLRNKRPDYFVLCGQSEDGKDNWFVLSREEFIRHSAANSTGGRIMQAQPFQFSRRGRYLHENTIWAFHCKTPSTMVDFIRHKESLKQFQFDFTATPRPNPTP